jgi:NAD(P)-dependent dehydrogenase (short-subunit alcohol dehydrogenase family)
VRVSGKRVLVTGGASGVGEASVRRFLAEGASVMFVDVDEQRGSALAKELRAGGAPVRFMHLDASADGDVATAVQAAIEDLGGIDVLHSNVGMATAGDALSTSIADWERTFAVNVRAPWLWSRQVIPHMRSAGWGAIVFTGSTSGMVGFPGALPYTASKGGLLNLMRSLALELAADGITVNAVSPGHLDTPMTRRFMDDHGDPSALARNLAAHAATVPVGRLGRPEEGAALVVFLASDDARFCTGGNYVCDGGLTAA